MHHIRCHLLLALDNGRNLLRELLIFVAAWDLRENELYFKLMANIMQAILQCGKLPPAYRYFREPKDIVSPAQAVIMKLLTYIYKTRQYKPVHSQSDSAEGQPTTTQPYPSKVEVQVVKFLLTEFRRVIIPQVCSVIFSQALVRKENASPEDFPVNLWDMERMYEGVYQYLEFFAPLSEHPYFKDMFVKWEIAIELIALIEDLDDAIPRSVAKMYPLAQRVSNVARPNAAAGASSTASSSQQPVSVERPYDPNSADKTDDNNEDQEIARTVPQNLPHHSSDNYPAGPTEDEPCNFEWRNLKKLAVTVLCNIIWRSALAQEQMGRADRSGERGRGLRALLGCLLHDDFNPGIREHAILTLRFALEGNEENQKILSAMYQERKAGKKATSATASASGEGRSSKNTNPAQSAASAGSQQEKVVVDGVEIPKEVLDLNAYEVVEGTDGQWTLRKRARASTTPA
jgi:hypothetical protein